MGTEPVIRLHFDAPHALEREHEENLIHGRAFSSEPRRLTPRTLVHLVLSTPTAELSLSAEVVMVAEAGPMRGVGLSLLSFDAETRARLSRFVQDEAFGAPRRQTAHASGPSGQRVGGPAQRLRKLNLAQQLELARRGELSDRVALERVGGRAVWEALLRNPRLTIAEVARISRKGTVPRHLIEQIVDNASWTKTPVVRRALLSNPKLGPELAVRVLKLAPRHELKKMVHNPAYPNAVRSAARRLMGDGS